MKSITRSVLVLAALMSGACTVGPNYSRPIVQTPDVYRSAAPGDAPTRAGASLGEQRWWEVFDDPILQDLIKTAIQQNFDVRIAASRVLQARAQLGITRADQAPSVTAGVGALPAAALR